MTGVVSEDALRGQQTRIMKAMRSAVTPSIDQGFRDIAQSLMSQTAGKGNYFETMNKITADRQKNSLDMEMGIYNQMKEQVARGNADAKGVDDAINEVAGNDPKIYAAIIQDLHSDPEPITAVNARDKVMRVAAERGITPLSVEKDRATINKLNADVAHAASGGDDPASIKEWKEFQSMTPEDQRKYMYMKRSGVMEVDKQGNMVPIPGATDTASKLEAAKTKGRAKGKKQGEAEFDLKEQLANYPALKSTIDELSELAKKATYTKAGVFYDSVGRQLNREPREGALARVKFDAKVKNQMLPLLRSTLGPQFTAVENEKMMALMGDLNVSPKEKQAALDAFLEQKLRSIQVAKELVKEDIPTGQPVKAGRLKYNPTTGEFE